MMLRMRLDDMAVYHLSALVEATIAWGHSNPTVSVVSKREALVDYLAYVHPWPDYYEMALGLETGHFHIWYEQFFGLRTAMPDIDTMGLRDAAVMYPGGPFWNDDVLYVSHVLTSLAFDYWRFTGGKTRYELGTKGIQDA